MRILKGASISDGHRPPLQAAPSHGVPRLPNYRHAFCTSGLFFQSLKSGHAFTLHVALAGELIERFGTEMVLHFQTDRHCLGDGLLFRFGELSAWD